MKYKEWTLIPWDGNPSLQLFCWRKSFGKGHISVGVGEFTSVIFSFGANSESSYSSTRWNYDKPHITEQETMDKIDQAHKHNKLNSWDRHLRDPNTQRITQN